jgi:hypothetical protein
MLMTAGIYDGPLAEPAIALVLVVVGMVATRWVRHVRGIRRAETSSGVRVPLVVAALLLGAFLVMALADRRLLLDATGPIGTVHATQALSLVLVLSYLPAIVLGRNEGWVLREVRFAALAFLLVAGGIAVMRASPAPQIDVFWMETRASETLARGENPYLVATVPDTGPTQTGALLSFVYPPTALYACWAAWRLGGDVRWAMLGAILVSGLALRGIARTDRVPGDPKAVSELPALVEDAPALLVWLAPKTLFFVEQSWNDALPLAFTLLAVLARMRKRALLAGVMMGIALSVKQSMFYLLPLAVLLFGRSWRPWLAMLGVAIALTAPFVLWDAGAFNHWVVVLQAQLPPRDDGLTVMNFFHRRFGVRSSAAPALVMSVVTIVVAVLRMPRGPYPFLLATTLTYFCFFVFNKWAFINYYFLLAGLVAACAAAVLPSVRWRPVE